MRNFKILIGLVFLLGLCLPLLAAQGQAGAIARETPQRGTAENDGTYSPAVPNQMVAPTLTLPQGTLIRVRLTEPLSSERNRPGDGFLGVLDQPLVAQGWVVAWRGQAADGRVVDVQNAGRVKGVSQLTVALSQLVLVDGQQVPIRTQLVAFSGGKSKGRDAQGVVLSSGIGAAIGGAVGHGTGAAIGAAAGAAAGMAGVLVSRGRPAELYPETLMTFRLEDPVSISTQQSAHAFRAVDPRDYENRGAVASQPRTYRPVETYPLPPYYYPPSPYYYYGGNYGYYGFAPRIYIVPRIYGGRGYYRRR
jgi:hypothetical protein